jgi:hypothetical protein
MWLRRLLRWMAWGTAILLLLIGGPIVTIEAGCRGSNLPIAAGNSRAPVTEAGERLPLTNSVLSYPEWYIVYAYQDFAKILEHADEAAFPYLGSIADYWTSFCTVHRIASGQGTIDLGEKAMLYIIGFSFTAELGLKGAYETTIGRLTAWLRGPEKTSEDRLAATMAADYAAFLDQKPWYEYPFRDQVRRLRAETPVGRPAVRAWERRFALTTEWTIKAAYARAIATSAGLDPAVLEIDSVVCCLDDKDTSPRSGIIVRKKFDNGRTLIRTPRYGAFTRVLTTFAEHDMKVFEIAGNDVIFLTALAPQAVGLDLPNAHTVFTYPVRSRPGWQRRGLLVSVPSLVETIREIGNRGATLEHVYDY